MSNKLNSPESSTQLDSSDNINSNKSKEYKGNITAKEAGNMVKKMVEDFENHLINKQ